MSGARRLHCGGRGRGDMGADVVAHEDEDVFGAARKICDPGCVCCRALSAPARSPLQGRCCQKQVAALISPLHSADVTQLTTFLLSQKSRFSSGHKSPPALWYERRTDASTNCRMEAGPLIDLGQDPKRNCRPDFGVLVRAHWRSLSRRGVLSGRHRLSEDNRPTCAAGRAAPSRSCA